MECVDSSSNYPRSVCGADSTDADTWIDRAPTDEDSFQCTFFRESKREPSNALSLSSDTYTDSDSEPDELPILQSIKQSSDKFLAGFEQRVTNENDSQISRAKDAPKVRFCAPVCIAPTQRKRWIQGGTGCAPVKLPRALKRNTCLKNNCMNSRNRCRIFNPYPALTPCYPILPEKALHPNGDVIKNDENVIEDRIVKNKRLLKSIEEMIRTMNETQMYETKMNVDSKPCIKPSNKIAKTNLIDEILNRDRRKRFRETPNDTEEMLIQRPFFKNQKLEKHLNESMQKAVTKYRTCWKWGEQGILKEERHVA